MYLIFDTETTGLPSGSEYSLEGKPHIVQIAVIMFEKPTSQIFKTSYILKPNKWNMTDRAFEVHGISVEHASRVGVEPKWIVDKMANCIRKAHTIVAHNVNFDLNMLRWEFYRHKKPYLIKDKNIFCTMEKSKDIVKMPLTSKQQMYTKQGYKNPKLSEAYEFFMGKPLVGAHDARVDCQACMDIFLKLKDGAF